MLKWQDVTYSEADQTILHRLDPRVKIIVLLATGFFIVLLDNPKILGSLLTFGIAGMIVSRLSPLKLKIAVVMIALGLWGSVFSQALFYEQVPRTAVLTVISPQMPVLGPLTKGLYIYQEGVIHGLKQGLRLTTMTTLGLLVCWTTDTRLLLLGMVKMRLPYSLSFMAVTAVKFIPALLQESMQVMTASRMRGGKRFGISLLIPILANCIRRSGTLAVAVESRAFRCYNQRTYLEELSFSRGEKWLLVGYMLLTVLITFSKVSYWLYQYGIYYHPGLRTVYEFTRVCL
ncbi:MAG: energy-coupling factor transporter transmembrane component T [Veillonellales bacterium]